MANDIQTQQKHKAHINANNKHSKAKHRKPKSQGKHVVDCLSLSYPRIYLDSRMTGE